MHRLAVSFLKSEKGETMIEYAFIAVLVSLAGIVAFEALGSSVFFIFELISSGLAESASTPGGS